MSLFEICCCCRCFVFFFFPFLASFIEYRSTICSVEKCGYGSLFVVLFLVLERDSHCFGNLWNKSFSQVYHFFDDSSSLFFTTALGPKLTSQFHVLLVMNFIP
ncbi:hypothetical protein AMTRI_Chr08g206080 [Amborella trichopoda]